MAWRRYEHTHTRTGMVGDVVGMMWRPGEGWGAGKRVLGARDDQ